MSVKGVDSVGKSCAFSVPLQFPMALAWAPQGCGYSLVSREVIADSIETVVGAEGMDGLVTIGGWDKNMPARVMALSSVK